MTDQEKQFKDCPKCGANNWKVVEEELYPLDKALNSISHREHSSDRTCNNCGFVINDYHPTAQDWSHVRHRDYELIDNTSKYHRLPK